MRSRPSPPVTLLLAGVVALAACGETPGGGLPADGVVGAWELVSGTVSGTALPMPPRARATLTLDGEQAGGTSFCNQYGSAYSIDGSAIEFAGLGGTEMACEPAAMAAETAYLSALEAVDTVAVDGADLRLRGEGVELRFRPVPPVPTSDLVGTRWVLETVLEGDVASSAQGRPAVLDLSTDGTVTGSTGCRTLSGTWTVSGDTVWFPDFAADGDCPDELRAQDEHVVVVLGDGFQVSIDGDRLTVSKPDGTGLVYRDGG